MWDIIHSNQIQFNESERTEFSSVSAISSNGSTYSIVNNNFVQIFDADTEKLIYYNEIPLGFDLDDPFLMISNGIFILFLFDSGKIFVNAVAKCNNAVFEAGDPFPKDNYSDTKALILDVLTNPYFSVYYESDGVSVINSHPYTGPPDLHIFGLSIDNENEEVEHVLLDLLNHFSFSYSIPDHLVSTDTNCESDIISLTKLIELTEKINEFDAKSLLILLDLNIHKYKCPSTVQQLLPYLLKLMGNDEYKKLVFALIITNADSFFNKMNINVIKMTFNDSDEEIFKEWSLNKLFQSSMLSRINFDDELLTSLRDE